MDSDEIIEGEKIVLEIGKMISIYLKTYGSGEKSNDMIPLDPCDIDLMMNSIEYYQTILKTAGTILVYNCTW